MQLRQHEDSYRLRFDNGMSLDFRARDGVFLGLGNVLFGRRKLRSPELPIMPLIEAPDGWRVTELRIKDIKQGKRRVTIEMMPYVQRTGRMDWLCADGQERWDVGAWQEPAVRDRGGSLRLVLRAVERTIGGVPFVGFSYSYKFRSRKHCSHRLHDRATWELGGWARGNSFWMQAPFGALQTTIKNKADFFSTAWRGGDGGMELQQFLPLFTALQGFTFQFDSRSLLVTTFEEPFAVRSLFQKDRGRNYLVHWHVLCSDMTGSLEFPALQVLCADTGELDEAARTDQYCAVREELHRQFAGQLGVNREPAVPAVCLAADGAARTEQLKRLLGELAHAGFDRVYMPELMSELPGSAPARKRVSTVIDHAHQLGLQVATPLADCACASPTVEEDSVDGEPQQPMRDGHVLMYRALVDPLARRALLGRLRDARRTYGVDVVFAGRSFDGVGAPFHWHAASVASCRGHGKGRGANDAPGAILSLDGRRWDLVAELQRLGYVCALQGVGGLASLDAAPRLEAVYGREQMCRDCVVRFSPDQFPEHVEPVRAYFQGCANRVSCAVECDAEADGGANGRRWLPGCAAVNRAYHAVRDHMEHSRCLPKGRGVLWTGSDPDVVVLWTYRDFAWRVGPDAEVFDVTAQQPVDVSSGAFHPGALRVYLAQNAVQP